MKSCTNRGCNCKRKQLNKWNRSWRNKLISDFNPGWEDLFIGLYNYLEQIPGRGRRGCHMFRQQTSLTEFFAVDLNGTTRLKLELFERYVFENRDAV